MEGEGDSVGLPETEGESDLEGWLDTVGRAEGRLEDKVGPVVEDGNRLGDGDGTGDSVGKKVGLRLHDGVVDIKTEGVILGDGLGAGEADGEWDGTGDTVGQDVTGYFDESALS